MLPCVAGKAGRKVGGGAMAVDNKHPDYAAHMEEWLLMRETLRGVNAVKMAQTRYLPCPSGFLVQADGGVEMYRAYITRARVPDILEPTLAGMVGVIHRNEVSIEMPAKMEPLWENATVDNLPLESFHRRVTLELLLTGRYSILTDVSVERDLPYLAGYITETLINWDESRDFYVMDETGLIRTGFDWSEQKQYRELVLDDGIYKQRVYMDSSAEEFIEVIPNRLGGGNLDTIPLVVSGPADQSLEVRSPPLEGVSRGMISMYQLDADYRWQLYMSGQETLFITGAETLPTSVGAAVVHGLPMGADAKYVSPSCKGIDAHRQAILDAREAAVAAGAALFDTPSGRESGDALRLRYSAQTATLTTIAQASGAALEKALRYVATFMGLNPEEVIVRPNLRFIDSTMTPADARQLMEVWLGGGISKLTLFENYQRGEITSVERTFEQEEDLIAVDPVHEEPDEPNPQDLKPPKAAAGGA